MQVLKHQTTLIEECIFCSSISKNVLIEIMSGRFFRKYTRSPLKVLRSPQWAGYPLRNICGIKDHEYVPLVISTSRSFPHSLLITGFVPRVTQQVPLVVLELFTLPKHLSSPPVFRRVRVAQSLVFCVMFCPSFFNLRILITPLVSSNSS